MPIITPKTKNRGRIGHMTKAQLKRFVQDNSGGGGVIVEESDGNPSVSPTSKIKVSNGTLTDDGSGVVTINTAGPTGVVTVKRFIIAASALTDSDTAQDLAIYTKTATEGIVNCRVRWGGTKFNYAGSNLYVGVGFTPSGGAYDDDTILLGRDIASKSANDWCSSVYYNNYGTSWTNGGSYHWRYQSNEMVHFGQAGVVYVDIAVSSGTVAAIDEGTVEIFLDIVDCGAGTTIS